MAFRRTRQRRHGLFPDFADVSEIGVGSLAVIYQAREIGTNRQVALKLMNVRDASPRSIESFERESIALGALSSHPNIVTLYRTFRTPDGRPVLVLELCDGAVADRLIDGAGIPVPEVVSIGVKIAGALETAHRSGILHRDVKPQNILVTEFGEPALADFGVAMLHSATQTTAGLFDFTTLHAAPELLEGSGTSAATDVYELASSLYQLIAGQSAFRAYEGESPASVILRIVRDPVRPLSGANVPIALSDLLIWAMSKDKDERPPTAAEFAAELAAVEIAQGWKRTQFLIRDVSALGSGLPPEITRMPDDVPRGLPSALAPARPNSGGWTPPPLTKRGDDSQGADDGWWSTPDLAAAAARQPETEPEAEPEPEPKAEAEAEPEPKAEAEAETEPKTEADPEPEADDGWWSAPPAQRDFYAARHHSPRQPETPFAPPELPKAVASPGPAPVPVWAVRAPPPTDAPTWVPIRSRSTGEPALDPLSPRPRVTLRAGASAVTVDERQLRLRTWFTHTEVPWSEVHGFRAEIDNSGQRAPTRGRIFALTARGPVELRGTRRPLAQLRNVLALLDGYRIRAQAIAKP